MSGVLDRVSTDANDAELISRVRGGDLDAFGLLFDRHREAATRLAHSLGAGADADDLAADAFDRVLAVLRDGGGPDVALRPYLLTAVRHCYVDRLRAQARTSPTDDLRTLDSGEAFDDPAVAGFESAAAARAFRSLPERWQLVLWHLEVEGQKPAEVAPLLGMSANAVSALAYRAREGLRQAFLQMHATEPLDAECTWTREMLGAYVRQGLSRRDSQKVADHLEHCRGCAAVYLELTEVNSELGALIGPAVLGSAAAGYLAATGSHGVGALAGVGVVWGRTRDVVAANSQAALAASAAVVAAVAAVGIVLVNSGSDSPSAGRFPSSGLGSPQPSASPSGPNPPPSSEPSTPVTTPTGNGTGIPVIPAVFTPPAHHSTGQGDHHPTTGPTAGPPTTPGTPPPPPVNARKGALGVTASVVRSSGGLLGLDADVSVSVAGLAPGHTTQLTLRLPTGSMFTSTPAGCQGVGLITTCTVDGDSPDLLTSVSSLQLLNVGLGLDALLPDKTVTLDLLP